jgi:hypothetical protein
LSRCKHCGIFFFTHPRNAGRKDLGCPFGCRQTHRKKSEKKRSIEYYRSPEGKIKKKYLNARRTNQGSSQKFPEQSDEDKIVGMLCSHPLDKATITYLWGVTSLIEERAVALDEILCMVHGILRQLSIEKGGKMVYGQAYEQGRSP